MNCQLWKPALFELSRGIETAETHEALLHVNECPDCALLLDQQRHLTGLLRTTALHADSVIPAVPGNLLAEFRANQVLKKSWTISLIRAAIFVIVILGGWMWYRSHHFEAPKTSSTAYAQDGEFIPLQYAENPANSFQVVRVELGSSDLQQLGFPGVPEWENRPVEADILVGEDGLPHAIRLVTTETQR